MYMMKDPEVSVGYKQKDYRKEMFVELQVDFHSFVCKFMR